MIAPVRVRFAPSPTGRMHMGNVRAALLNYLFVRQQGGTFILRIEDTDASRNIADGVQGILDDLKWAGITVDEGVGSKNNEPYFQSQRQELYLQSLNRLIEEHKVYKCFCSTDQLEQMRAAQRAAGQPPRYDGRCRRMPVDQSKKMQAEGTPFIWRFARDEKQILEVPTFGAPLSFDMAHFYDFAITRTDESFTFLFTNAVDDVAMGITHVMRGSDHLSNTALQAALYAALGSQIPTFVHLALLCGPNGKKLSKRDFGFSLIDVQQDGIVPEALAHYLLTVGGSSIDEVLSTDQLMAQPLEHRLQHTGHITYDLDALRAINRSYIHQMPADTLIAHLAQYEDILGVEKHEADNAIITVLQKEVNTLAELRDLLVRVTGTPAHIHDEILAHCGGDQTVLDEVVAKAIELFSAHEAAEALGQLKAWCKAEKKSSLHLKVSAGKRMKVVLGTVRYAAVGMLMGIGMGALVKVMSSEQIVERLKSL